jgi:hypothetical protein
MPSFTYAFALAPLLVSRHLKLTAGGAFAVFGGSMDIAGLQLVTITGLNNQYGAGLQTFVGALCVVCVTAV